MYCENNVQHTNARCEQNVEFLLEHTECNILSLWLFDPQLTSYPASMCSSCGQTFASALRLHTVRGMVFRGADEFQRNRSTSSEELHKMYCLLNMIMVMRFGWMGWARNVACVEDMRNVKEIKYVNTGMNEKMILKSINTIGHQLC